MEQTSTDRFAADGTTPLPDEYIPAWGMTDFKEALDITPLTTNRCTVTDQLTTYKGFLGVPSTIVLPDGNGNPRVFMAYSKGNSDIFSGEIWWAVSNDDGATWTPTSAPLLYGYYHRGHSAGYGADDTTPGSTCAEGFGRTAIATYTDGANVTWIHIYATYTHPTRERGAADPGQSFIDYRFQYSPADAFGITANTSQLYYVGSYTAHSGKLVWSYDDASLSTYGDDSRLDAGSTVAPWYHGYTWPSSVTRDTAGTYYMLVENYSDIPLTYETSTDATHWSDVKTIDMSMVTANYPDASFVQSGIWYGTLSGRTGMFGFLALWNGCGANIVPVSIDLCSFSVSPSSTSFPSAGGSRTISVTTDSFCGWSAASNDSFITLSTSSGTGSGSVDATIAANTAAQARSGTITVAGQLIPIAQAGQSGLSAPASVTATFDGAAVVNVSWAEVSGATQYDVYRFTHVGAYPSSPYASVTAPSTSYADNAVSVGPTSVGSAGTTYLYAVKAVASGASSGFSLTDYAATFTFTDLTLTRHQSLIRGVHVSDLRWAIDSIRGSAGLAAQWSDYSPQTGPILASQFQQLRTALDGGRVVFGLGAWSYAYPATSGTQIYVEHVTEIRAATR